jgi:hypothetical protein
MTSEVIGVGFGCTGTLSRKVARCGSTLRLRGTPKSPENDVGQQRTHGHQIDTVLHTLPLKLASG